MKNLLTNLALMLLIGIANNLLAMEPEDIELEEFDPHFLYHKGDLELFRRAVEKLNLDIDEPNKFGLGVAHLAAMHGEIEWLALLFSLGADLDEPDACQHWTPIAWALAGKHLGAFRLLQNYGLEPVMPGRQFCKTRRLGI